MTSRQKRTIGIATDGSFVFGVEESSTSSVSAVYVLRHYRRVLNVDKQRDVPRCYQRIGSGKIRIRQHRMIPIVP